jgi:hypothetical protein
MNPAIKRNIMFALLLFACFLALIGISKAETSRTIDATVKLGICGNDLAEDNEDCDNADLKGKTCETIGYASGTLSCLPSCDFDTSLCVPIVPSEEGEGGAGFHSHGVTTTEEEAISYILPEVIRLFDTNGDGKLTLNELYGMTKKWFDLWKNTLVEQIEAQNKGTEVVRKKWTCDLNNDGTCDLVDFSILMYYVGR